MSKDESRMVQDPICGKQVDTLRARAVGIFGGATYYFCSSECKAKFKDPRQGQGTPPAVERRKPEPTRDEPLEREERKQDLSAPRGEDNVRYARSRIRRITGEVGTPVVQIDLNPNKKPIDPEADGELPVKSGGRWMMVVLALVILAGGALYFILSKGK